jgi:FixJ family two-component response regulator
VISTTISSQEWAIARGLTAMPTVFVVDDDISVRESVASLMHCAGWRVLTFACGEQFLAHKRTGGPGCVVLDIKLPELDGFDVQKLIAADELELPIIFISGFADVPMTVRAMKAGAMEFLTKPFSDVALLSAVQDAIDRSRVEFRRSAEIKLLKECYARLSDRECEVLELVVAGRLNKQIAGKLGIREVTVKVHRGRVMQKMRAKTLVDLVTMVAKMDRAGAIPRSQ